MKARLPYWGVLIVFALLVIGAGRVVELEGRLLRAEAQINELRVGVGYASEPVTPSQVSVARKRLGLMRVKR